MIKSTLMKNAKTFSAKHCSEKEAPRGYQRLRTMAHDILKQQQQHIRAAVYSLKRAEVKGKDCRSWMSKSSGSTGGKWSFEHDKARKGKGKGTLSRSPD